VDYGDSQFRTGVNSALFHAVLSVVEALLTGVAGEWGW